MYYITCRIQFLLILLSSVQNSHGFLPMLQEKTRNSLNVKGSSYYPHWFIQSDDNDNIDNCDLTAEYCDTNCCNDKECKKYQKEVFVCPEKSNKAVSSQEQVDFECSYQSSPEKRSWWLYFLCYVRDNSPFHVKFFEEDDIIKTLESMREKIGETVQNKKNIRNHPHLGMESYLREGYMNDDAIFLRNANGGNKERFFLLFPINILSSIYCTDMPLKYLEQRNAECLRIFSANSCSKANSELNLNDYLFRNKSSKLIQKITINLPRTGISLQENFHLSDIIHNINCSLEGEQFLVASKYSTEKFPLTNSIHKNNKENGGFKKMCDIEKVSFVEYNEEKSLCENVLVESRMKVFWNGTSISKIHINYHLADIPIPNHDNHHLSKSSFMPGKHEIIEKDFDHKLNNRSMTNNDDVLEETMERGKAVYNQEVVHFFVKQKFSVEYQHVDMNNSATTTTANKHPIRDNNATGYLIGEDITPYTEKDQQQHSLDYKENGTEGFTFGLWKRDLAGNCNGHVPIQLGLDIQTNCRIDDEELENLWDDCDLLREHVGKLQDSLISSGSVSAGDSLINGTQIPILRTVIEEETSTTIPILQTNQTNNNTDDNSTDIDPLLAAVDPWLIWCEHIPAHLLIDIIYDGKVNRFGRHSIIGVHVDFMEETWAFDKLNSTPKNLFTLKSSVKFHTYKPKSNLPRFWELQLSPIYGATSLLNAFEVISIENFSYGNEKLLMSAMQLTLLVGIFIFLYCLRKYL